MKSATKAPGETMTTEQIETIKAAIETIEAERDKVTLAQIEYKDCWGHLSLLSGSLADAQDALSEMLHGRVAATIAYVSRTQG